MESRSANHLPLVVIVGPTGSGKTAIATELAKKYSGEIICADSRTVYKGMDIGTAKPNAEEQADVQHWGINLVEPGERFTVADFKRYAEGKIEEIRARGRIPFLVGGTGLYIDAVLFDYQFAGRVDNELRQTLEAMSVEDLQTYCHYNNINIPENKQNKRHLVQAIERNGRELKRRKEPIGNSIIVGISTDKDVLNERITHRTEQLFAHGVVGEATLLGRKYGWFNEALTGNIYRIAHSYLLGEVTLEEAKIKNTTMDRQLAKRQITWFKRNPYITWLSLARITPYIREQLAKSNKA